MVYMRPQDVNTSLYRPRNVGGGQPSQAEGFVGALASGLQGFQQGVQLGQWTKDIAQKWFGVDMRSPKQKARALEVERIMSLPNPSLNDLVKLRRLDPDSFKVYSDAVSNGIDIQQGRLGIEKLLGEKDDRERARALEEMSFDLSGKLFYGNGELNTQAAHLLRTIDPEKFHHHLKAGRAIQSMDPGKRLIATTVNDMMAGVLNRLRHMSEAQRPAAWRAARRNLAMQMTRMQGQAGSKAMEEVLKWAVKDIDDMMKNPETGASVFSDENLDRLLLGMAQFSDMVKRSGAGRDVAAADLIGGGEISEDRLRQMVATADRLGTTGPAIDAMRSRLAQIDAAGGTGAGAGTGGVPRREGESMAETATRIRQNLHQQHRERARDLFGGGGGAPAGAGALGTGGAPAGAGAAAAIADGTAGPPGFLALEAAQQGGLPYDITDAPRDLAQVEQGRVYRLPNGQIGVFDGEAWTVGNAAPAAPDAGAQMGGGVGAVIEPPTGMGARPGIIPVEEGTAPPARPRPGIIPVEEGTAPSLDDPALVTGGGTGAMGEMPLPERYSGRRDAIDERSIPAPLWSQWEQLLDGAEMTALRNGVAAMQGQTVEGNDAAKRLRALIQKLEQGPRGAGAMVEPVEGATGNYRGTERQGGEGASARIARDQQESRDRVRGRRPNVRLSGEAVQLQEAVQAMPEGEEKTRLAAAVETVLERVKEIAAGFQAIPRGIRNNNPLNIEKNDANAWPNRAEGTDPRFETFRTPEDGIRNAAKVLQTYKKRGIRTLRAALRRWAPPSENDTEAYIMSVSGRAGIGPDQPIDLADPAILERLLPAMIQHENGQQPYSPDVIRAGIMAAQGDEMDNARMAREVRKRLSVPRNGLAGKRLRDAVRGAMRQYGGDEKSWRRVLAGKASQTLRSITQQGALDLGRFS